MPCTAIPTEIPRIRTVATGRDARVSPKGVAIRLEHLDTSAGVAASIRGWGGNVGVQVGREISGKVGRSVSPRFRSGFRPASFGADVQGIDCPILRRGSCLCADIRDVSACVARTAGIN